MLITDHELVRGMAVNHGWFELLLLALAAFRLTHLVVFDKITEPMRKPFEGRPFLGTLVTCYWCAGIWISGGLVAGQFLWPALFRWVVGILAVAGAQALIELAVQSRKKAP